MSAPRTESPPTESPPDQLRLMLLPTDLLEQVAHATCPVDCMLRWRNACRLAQASHLWYTIVRDMKTFHACGNVAFDDTTGPDNFDMVSRWRAVLPPSITRGFSSAMSATSAQNLQQMRVCMEAALVVHRVGFEPVWLLVVACDNLDTGAFRVHVHKLHARDVISLLRCPPGFQKALSSEHERLARMRATLRTNPKAFTAAELANAHTDVRPSSQHCFMTYPDHSHPIGVDTISTFDVWQTRPGPTLQLQSESALAHIDIAPEYGTLRAVCASEQVPATRPPCYFYSQHLEVEYHGSMLPISVDLIFDRKAREAMGFSTNNTVGRYEFLPLGERPHVLDDDDDMSATEQHSPFSQKTRQVQRELSQRRWRMQLDEEERTSRMLGKADPVAPDDPEADPHAERRATKRAKRLAALANSS